MRSRSVMQYESAKNAQGGLRQAGTKTWMLPWPADGALAISADDSEYEKIRTRCLPAIQERAGRYPHFRAAMFCEHKESA